MNNNNVNNNLQPKLWSGRFSKPTHPSVEEYTASIRFDRELVYEDILGSLAHAAMLEHCGIIGAEENNRLQHGLKQLAKKIAAGEIEFKTADEDIHMNIERLLSVEIGDLAGKLHTARSRNDQVALDMHLYLRKNIIIIVELLITLQNTLLQLAEKHKGVILPGYTHLQRAQPIYLVQYVYAYIAMLQRDVERLQDNWPRVNRSPLGAGALAGTTFPIDRNYTADLLGFENIYFNTLDAVSDRDFIVEFLAAGSIIMLHISRLSEELILWSSQEFNFISFDDAFCTGSSIMPQKKNPDVVELARGKTGRVYGALFSVLTLLKGLPLAYNKDLQEDKEPLFDVVKTLRQTLEIFNPLLATLTINSDAMRLAVNKGYLNATALAEYLVKKSLTFRAAHEVVGKMVARCIQKQCCLEELSLEEMREYTSFITEDVYSILIVENIVSACNKNLQIECMHYQQQLKFNQQWITEKKQLITAVINKFELAFND